MQMTILDADRWTMKDAETPFSYWASLTPLAPFLGVQWRFAPDLKRVDQHNAAPQPKSPHETPNAMAPLLQVAPLSDPKSPPSSAAEPFMAAEPKTLATADELTRIKGIGPKLAQQLLADGITKFAQIAKWTERDVDLFEATSGVIPGRIMRDDWVGQAKVLAKSGQQ